MEFTTRPEVKGTFGVVSSTHWLASQCGMSVLERGGNAFDAAVAAGFVLQVVEPQADHEHDGAFASLGRSATLSADADGLRRLFSNAEESLVRVFRS
jgi:hypothetical protein